MAAEQITLVALLVLGLALLARRLAGTVATIPMLVVAFGLLAGDGGLGVLELRADDETIILVAEATLAMLLFSDAARIDLGSLREGAALPARLLGIGLPLTVLVGVGIALLLVGGGVGEALLLAAILSPTDAALGQAVVGDERVPVAVRQGLNVESGLNDGLVLPVFAVAVAMLVGDELPDVPAVLVQVGGGLAVGALVGGLLPRLLAIVRDRWGLDALFEQLGVLAIVALAYGMAESLGTNGFLASFVAGGTLKAAVGEDAERLTAYTEDSAQLFSVVALLLFAATLLPDALAATSPTVVGCAVLALTVMRMVPVVLALAGTGLRWPTKLFLAWFGPRGLASILLGLLFVAELGDASPEVELVKGVVGWTVLLSVVLHGATAAPLAGRYAAWFARGMDSGDDMVEADETSRPLLRWQRR